MGVYAVGDIQGCQQELETLLAGIGFDRARDHLWLTGDLVNRGPQSLEALRFVKALGAGAITVLGNHDLHLLAVAGGHVQRRHYKDTIDAVLTAPDREELLHWLRHRPLLHHDPNLGFTMVHAGLPPQWDLAQARRRAAEVEAVLRGADHPEFFAHMYGNAPHTWRAELTGWSRLRFITNCFTRMRYCSPEGVLELTDKGPPGTQKPGYLPWFQAPGRASAGERIVFGHWSTLQMHSAVSSDHGVFPLDNGCIWGGRLTALRLDDLQYHHVRCDRHARPVRGTPSALAQG